MKKKAENRLRPFLENGISADELEKKIQALSPGDLGEIKQLLLLKIREMEEELGVLKKHLEQAKCSKIIMDDRLSSGQSAINELRRRWHVFNNVFEERQKSKILKIEEF